MGFVIQAIETVRFEDGLKSKVLHGGFWGHCGCCNRPRIDSKTLLGCRLILKMDPRQTKFRPFLFLQSGALLSMLALDIGKIPNDGLSLSFLMGYHFPSSEKVSIQTNNKRIYNGLFNLINCDCV